MQAPLAALGQGDRGEDIGGHDNPQGRPAAASRAVGGRRDTDPAAEEHGKATRGLKTDAEQRPR